MNTITTHQKRNNLLYLLMKPMERLAILESIRGMWKNRRPDPIKELQKMRRERERKLPSLR